MFLAEVLLSVHLTRVYPVRDEMSFGTRRVRGGSTASQYHWTKELFLTKIQEIAARLGTTSIAAFRADPDGVRVYSAFYTNKAKWGYGSWSDAVEAAGLEPVFRWTNEAFLTKLREIVTRLGTASTQEIQNDSEGSKLCQAFHAHKSEWGYNSWSEAVETAGLDPVGVFRWTKELFLAQIRSTAARLETTSSLSFQNDSEGGKIYWAFDHNKTEWGYESWSDAVRAAGLEPVGVFRWTKELFLERLRSVAARLGTISTAIIKDDPEGYKLYKEFYNHRAEWGYNSWDDLKKDAFSLVLEEEETQHEETPVVIEGSSEVENQGSEEEAEWIKAYPAITRFLSWADICKTNPKQIAFYVRELAVCVARENGGEFEDLRSLLTSRHFQETTVPCLGRSLIRMFNFFDNSCYAVLSYLDKEGLLESVTEEARERLKQN